jgi:hypothetical protein
MTKELYKSICNKVSSGEVKLIDVIQDFDLDEKFFVGGNSTYFFCGTIIDLYRDLCKLEEYFKNRYHVDVSILNSTIKRVHAKSMYEPKPMIAIILNGYMPGKVWFSYEYPAFIQIVDEYNKKAKESAKISV